MAETLQAHDARHTDAQDESPAVRTRISLIVPMHNEAECVDALVGRLQKLQEQHAQRYDFDFVFVDDASRDGTAERLAECAERRLAHRVVQHTQNRGIAAAISTGLRASDAELAASIDADASYDPEVVALLAPLVTGNVAMATASPYHPQGRVLNLPAWRIALSRLASRVYSVVMPQRLSCYTCCVRVYRRDAVAGCQVENDGFVGIAELAWAVLRAGYQIAEAPAVLRPRVAGVSKMRTARATVGHLRLIAHILWQRAVRSPAPRVPVTQCR